MIIHCDRCTTKRITFLSDTEIPFGVFNLLLHLICLLGDSNQHSKCKRNFEDISNSTKDILKWPRWVIRLSQWFITLCFWLYCMLLNSITKICFCFVFMFLLFYLQETASFNCICHGTKIAGYTWYIRYTHKTGYPIWFI